MDTRRGGVLLAALVCLTAPARAQEAELPGLDEAALEAEFDFDDIDIADEFALLVQEDVVVTASRRAQRIDDSPSAITVLTREDLLASPFDNIADVLRVVPGMDVLLNTIAIAATGTRSGSNIAGSNVLVLVDGRDVLDPLFQLPLLLGLPLDVDTIERIEVIRGPAYTLSWGPTPCSPGGPAGPSRWAAPSGRPASWG
ncbi:MAG: TonB-dependent receptor plug domain-containing protein [Deltaproteobacteria bacterium]|nr:TonB-dependent receptor plug domain-containing protein [Deltaproteobacteria bacterium]